MLAVIPEVRVDLADHVRPEEWRMEGYGNDWTDWLILRRPEQGAPPPALAPTRK